jgi:hypothetical protein
VARMQPTKKPQGVEERAVSVLLSLSISGWVRELKSTSPGTASVKLSSYLS